MTARAVRRGLRAAGTAALAAVLVAGALGTVAAAEVPDDAVGLSVDGVTWTPRLEADLFDPALRWIPGHAEDATLWVRNQSGRAATGWAEVVVAGGGDLPADLEVRTSIGDEPWTEGVRSRAVELDPEEVVPVRFSVSFDPASGNETQLESASLVVHVTLTDPDAVVPSPIGGSPPPTPVPPGDAPRAPDAAPEGVRPPSAALPVTGGDVLPLLLVAGAAVVAGALILVRRRRG